jgi:hypothetical protein
VRVGETDGRCRWDDRLDFARHCLFDSARTADDEYGGGGRCQRDDWLLIELFRPAGK